MPYRVYGGLRFFERQEIKHALAYLRLIANPDDDGALLRVINFPTRGIGARSLEQLQEAARMRGMSLWAGGLRQHAGGQGRRRASPHSSQLIEAHAQRDARACRCPRSIEHVLEHSGLIAHYQNEKEGADRLENLNELVNAAAAFVDEARRRSRRRGGETARTSRD